MIVATENLELFTARMATLDTNTLFRTLTIAEEWADLIEDGDDRVRIINEELTSRIEVLTFVSSTPLN